jgi:hypothetical protein
MLRSTLVLLLMASPVLAAQPKRDVAIEKAWYTPIELLTLLAERDGVRWTLPETLAGRALVGGETTTSNGLLDSACKQWGLAWTTNNDVVVVHRTNDERLKKLVQEMAGGATAAAWELGWLRDARALPYLADALNSTDPAMALAAAQAIEVLDTMVPLGRDERVDALPAGRVSLAAAFPPKANMLPLLESSYPAIRAAALRLLIGQGGKAAEEAKTRTSRDSSAPVQRVRQQLLVVLPATKPPEGKTAAPLPLPEDPAAVKAACAKMVEELPGLEKQSAWEEMRWRVRSLASWSRRGEQTATDTLIELCSTKIQFGWFPGYVQQHLAATGSPAVLAKLKEIFPKADRATLCRGLEQSLFGNPLLAITRPHLNEQTVC